LLSGDVLKDLSLCELIDTVDEAINCDKYCTKWLKLFCLKRVNNVGYYDGLFYAGRIIVTRARARAMIEGSSAASGVGQRHIRKRSMTVLNKELLRMVKEGDQTLFDHIQCPVCLQVPKEGPIMRCKHGHLMVSESSLVPLHQVIIHFLVCNVCEGNVAQPQVPSLSRWTGYFEAYGC